MGIQKFVYSGPDIHHEAWTRKVNQLMNTTDKMRHSQQLKATQKLLVEAALKTGNMVLQPDSMSADDVHDMLQVFATLTSQFNEQMARAGRK